MLLFGAVICIDAANSTMIVSVIGRDHITRRQQQQANAGFVHSFAVIRSKLSSYSRRV